MKKKYVELLVPFYRGETMFREKGKSDCPATCDGFVCTRAKGHSGAHVATGAHNQIVEIWDDEK